MESRSEQLYGIEQKPAETARNHHELLAPVSALEERAMELMVENGLANLDVASREDRRAIANSEF
jgi:hypothetical protein